MCKMYKFISNPLHTPYLSSSTGKKQLNIFICLFKSTVPLAIFVPLSPSLSLLHNINSPSRIFNNPRKKLPPSEILAGLKTWWWIPFQRPYPYHPCMDYGMFTSPVELPWWTWEGHFVIQFHLAKQKEKTILKPNLNEISFQIASPHLLTTQLYAAVWRSQNRPR